MDNINAMKMFLALGEMTNQNETKEDKLKYRERIVFATMKASIPNWTPPDNWHELSIKEREKRIKLIEKLK